MLNGFTKYIVVLLFSIAININAIGQCAICSKTASQLGEGPAHALNSAIIYLMIAPFAIIGFIAYKWWKSQKIN